MFTFTIFPGLGLKLLQAAKSVCDSGVVSGFTPGSRVSLLISTFQMLDVVGRFAPQWSAPTQQGKICDLGFLCSQADKHDRLGQMAQFDLPRGSSHPRWETGVCVGRGPCALHPSLHPDAARKHAELGTKRRRAVHCNGCALT